MVNNDFVIDKESNVHDFSTFNFNNIKNRDFIDNSSSDILVYFVFPSQNRIPKTPNRTYIFKKNKLYKFSSDRFIDEVGTQIDQYNDIWYDSFLFVFEKDYKQAMRYLKLKNMNIEKGNWKV